MSSTQNVTADPSAAGFQAAAPGGRVRYRQSGSPVTYANVVEVRCGADEVVLAFGYGQPVRTASKQNGEESVATDLVVDPAQRIVMSPRAAKRLALSLGESLRRLEAQAEEARTRNGGGPSPAGSRG